MSSPPALFTAIIHLRVSPTPNSLIKPTLDRIPGIEQVRLDVEDDVIVLDFDAEQTCLGEIVGVIEGFGLTVCGIAQRRLRPTIAARSAAAG